MNRYRSQVLAIASISFGLLAAVPARAATLTQVSRTTWGATNVPSYVNMYIYVPDKLATNPPIVVAHHSCGTPATSYISSIGDIKAAADTKGFVLILPEATGQNCWDVGSTKSLTHDGGGDTQAIAEMVKYALSKYKADATRVYAMGGSSGAMMTQALMAVYPDIFKAGSARAGVPAGCWADGYSSSNQWSNNCANGTTTKTAQQWGDLVRAMDKNYTGPRRRIQLFQGTADATISYNNMGESIKEWTNVLGLSATPTSTDMITTSISTYTRQFWKNACGYTVLEAWSGKNGSHSMPYEQAAILTFFGLDSAGGADPEPSCSGDGSVGDAGSVSGSGGTTGAGGARDGGSDVRISGSGGEQGSGGSSGTGGAVRGTGGSPGIGGTSSNGGSVGSGGVAGTGGNGAGIGGSMTGLGDTSPNGCGCAVGSHAGRSASGVASLLLAAFAVVLRRRRTRR